MQRELEENNRWYDNQQQLIADLREANEAKHQLELQLQQYRNNHGPGKCQRVATFAPSEPERMNLTNASQKQFFDGCKKRKDDKHQK